MDDRCFHSLRLSATLAGGIAMLRSASTPLLNRPWAPALTPDLATSAELQVPNQIPRPPSVTHLASCFSVAASPLPPISRCRSVNEIGVFSEVSDTLSSASLLSHILTSSGLEGRSVTVASPPRTGSRRRHSLFEVGDGGASDGYSGGDNGREGGKDSGSDAMDAYYAQMIKTDPGNSLLLGNYAKYLKEVRGDSAKAEEYCERAMLANPHDHVVLTMYADLVWEGDRDAPRAESYFDRAMKVAPDDCFVMASYAKFLWDSEEEGGEGGVRESSSDRTCRLFHTAAARERIAAS
ncbi:uncharacterized protein LOC141826347 [Curcuma longa]|uniref:uncharacterized protein LOC141826347 n=1 Tax=Curcuma longa TaxID=136217 RepID=UPI003D9FAFC6